MEILSTIGSAVVTPLYYAVSGVLLAWRRVLELVPGVSDGWVWVLSIVGLTITVRALLLPVFLRQLGKRQGLHDLQGRIKDLQRMYAHDRERLAEEQMKLWKEHGTSPFASCLSLLLQLPIFFAVFRLVDLAAKHGGDGSHVFLSGEVAQSLGEATVLGGRIAETFVDAQDVATRVVAVALVLAMVVTQLVTQRRLGLSNVPADVLREGAFDQQQRMLLVVLPVLFTVGGALLPVGVLVHWLASMLWTMGQQLYVVRRHPTPGSAAAAAADRRTSTLGPGAVPSMPAGQRLALAALAVASLLVVVIVLA